jgi:hypothetical protein
MCLGPGRGPKGEWLIDCEVDGDQGEESLSRLVGGEVITTRGWSSTRGGHRLATADGKRLLELLAAAGAKEGTGHNSGVWHLKEFPGLEIRVGGFWEDGVVKQCQSVCPPTVGDDGKPRQWNGVQSVAELPEAAYAALEAIAERRAIAEAEEEPTSGGGELSPEQRAILYLRKCEPAVSGQEGHDKTLSTACRVGPGFDLPQDVTLRLLQDWNKDCEPPWSEKELKRKVDEAYRLETRPRGWLLRQSRDGQVYTRPEIFITTEELNVNNQAVKALAADDSLFQRNHQLVHVVRTSAIKQGDIVRRQAGTPIIRPMQAATLREILTSVARWRVSKPDRSGNVKAVNSHPPAWSMVAILARGQWEGIRHLAGIIEVPTLRADGSVIQQPGYDEATGLLYLPSGDFPKIPGRPTLADAKQAVTMILDVVQDFPFKDGHNAAFLGSFLTPFARYLIDGPVPLFLFEANTSGAGKTKLCDIISIVTTGREMTRTGYYHDAIEMDKQITATCLGGDSVVLFDNIENGGRFGNASLDRALTGRTYRGRILGKSEMTPPLDLTSVFYASGNNLSLIGDFVRRVVPCRLESPMERPEQRTGFAVSGCDCGCDGDLLDHVRRHRGELVCAALTILRAFILAGKLKPEPDLVPMDFPAWSAVVRNAVYWATAKDPAVGRDDLSDSDPNRLHFAAFVDGWHEVQTAKGVNGMTSADLVRWLKEDGERALPQFQTIRDAISDLWPKLKPGELPSSGQIGMKIQAIRDKPFGHKMFKTLDVEHHAQVWSVVVWESGEL